MFSIFKNLRFWYQKKAHVFLITPGEFYIWKEYCLGDIKGAWSDRFQIFSNFQKFWYQMKAHNFLIIPGEFYSWKMYRLENVNENVTSYGKHN